MKATSAPLVDMVGHFVIVMAVLASATYLAVTGAIHADTIATVYGAALGFTGGAVASKRPVTVRNTDTTDGA